MHAATQSPTSPSNAPGVACGDLVRRFPHSTYLDFTDPQECPRCRGKLEVKDHRAPWFSPPYTASKEWRYEVACETCGWCDCNGYANRREVLAAYPTNSLALPPTVGSGESSSDGFCPLTTREANEQRTARTLVSEAEK